MPKPIFRSQGGNGVEMHEAVLFPANPTAAA